MQANQAWRLNKNEIKGDDMASKISNPRPMTSAVVNSNVAILLLVVAPTVCEVLFCCIDLSVLSSFAIILLGKREREPIALLRCDLAIMKLSMFCVSFSRCMGWYLV